MDWTIKLFAAVFDADLARVKESISNGADISAIIDDRDVLSAAIVSDNTDQQIIKILLDSGANPNLRRNDGTTALYWAASSNDSELVRILIEAGARVDAEQPEEAYTSLHQASEHGNFELVKLLLKAGGEVVLNKFDYVSRTPLMWAIERGNIEIAKALIEAGSDVNAHDESHIGNTALLIATRMENFKLVELLLEAGADPTIAGWMGITAMSLVQKPITLEEQRILELFARKSCSV